MPKALPILLILCVWGAIYLPGLGEPELRGEEARRILPALGMIETGDWIVPRIAGEIYANKPPLLNWAVAAAFLSTGRSDEGIARLVSALSLLGLALASFVLLRKDLGAEGSLVLALATLTCLNLVAKGRIIEIDAPYAAIFGVACFLWLRLWTDRRPGWLLWTAPYALLGLACLLKGPVHLVFWFPFVLATLRFAGQTRELLRPAHFLGLAVMAAVFLPWMALNLRAVGVGENSVGNWAAELALRGDVSHFDWGRWLSAPFRIAAGFLPWLLPLLHALRTRRWRGGGLGLRHDWPMDAALFGSLVGVAAGFLVVCLLPANSPRYFLPLYPLAALAAVALHRRLPEEVREAYESFARRLLKPFIPLLAAAPAALAFVGWQRGVSPPLAAVAVSPLLVAATAWLAFGRLRKHGALLHTPLLLAAAALGALPAMQTLYRDRDLFRDAAAEIAAKVPAGGRIVLYADRETHLRHTRLLRLVYYFRPPAEGIGESGGVPADAALLLGREGAEEAMRAKLADRSVRKRETLSVGGREIVLLTLGNPDP